MDREQRKDIYEAVGLAAIVASLIFLALEVRQNTTAMSAAAFQDRSETLQDLAITIATSEVLSRIDANYLVRPPNCADEDISCYEIDHEYVDSLTPEEHRQYRHLLTAHAHRLRNLSVQYEYGLLTDDYYRGGVIGAIRVFMPRWEAFDVPQGIRLQRLVEDYKANQ